MSKRKNTLLLGYARRMEQVARLATEMNDIEASYRREFGGDAWEADLKGAITGERLARLASELRADAPGQPDPLQDDTETRPEPAVAPGAALGLAPAPRWLSDGLGDQLTTAEQVVRDA